MPTDPIASGISPFTPAPLVAEVQARCRQIAAVTIALRRAWVATEGVPALRLWRRWAAQSLDYELRDPRAAHLAERQASRAALGYDCGADMFARLVADAAYSATVAWRRVVLEGGDGPARRPTGTLGRRPENR